MPSLIAGYTASTPISLLLLVPTTANSTNTPLCAANFSSATADYPELLPPAAYGTLTAAWTE
jgi:hypothetical protein